MKKTERKDVFRSGLFAMWGLGTLVLLFCVVLLVYELAQRDEAPYATANPRINGGVPVLAQTDSSAMREILLYFASPEGAALVA